jgi:hypothetical protein
MGILCMCVPSVRCFWRSCRSFRKGPDDCQGQYILEGSSSRENTFGRDDVAKSYLSVESPRSLERPESAFCT